MHYHCEIVTAPTDYVEGAVEKIMAPFNEDPAENDCKNCSPCHAFWDWYLIGGRWDGQHESDTIGKDRLEQFTEWCTTAGITVSGVQSGKPELKPLDQSDRVMVAWREMVPEMPGFCPVFNGLGYNPKPNFCTWDELSEATTCETLIVQPEPYSGSSYDCDLWHSTIWNGYTHQETAFKGQSIKDWLSKHGKEIKPDWICVTVDYHS